MPVLPIGVVDPSRARLPGSLGDRDAGAYDLDQDGRPSRRVISDHLIRQTRLLEQIADTLEQLRACMARQADEEI